MRVVVIMLYVSLFALAACSTSTPTPTGPSVSPSHDPRWGAPSVEAPRDLRQIAMSTCDLLVVDSDLAQLGISAEPYRRALPLGETTCVWNDARELLTFNVTVHGARDILIDTYRAHLTPIFEPFTLENLPAVREKTSADAVVCSITVATAPNQGIETTWFGAGSRKGQRRDPCDSATAVTRAILAKLPPAR